MCLCSRPSLHVVFFICNFAYMQLRIGHFSETCPHFTVIFGLFIFEFVKSKHIFYPYPTNIMRDTCSLLSVTYESTPNWVFRENFSLYFCFISCQKIFVPLCSLSSALDVLMQWPTRMIKNASQFFLLSTFVFHSTIKEKS